MNERTKSVLLIVATLVIGMVLGSLLTGAIANRRLDNLAEARVGRMSAFFLDAIEPESEEQAEAIRAVLDGAAPRFREVFDDLRTEMDRLRDSVMAELDTILTDEQKERLEDRMRFGRRHPRPGPNGKPGYRDGPPPELPPGMRPPPPGDSSRRFRRRPPPAAAPGDSVARDTMNDADAAGALDTTGTVTDTAPSERG